MLECVINVSEGQNSVVIDELRRAVGSDLLDIHTDPDHNRSVFTMVGTSAPRRLATAAVRLINIAHHSGVHPRLGVVDVVPFVPLRGSTMQDAVHARNDFAQWASTQLQVPCFVYEPEQSLPTIRRTAWTSVMPAYGNHVAHPTAGAMCVGARMPLIAYNVWLATTDLAATRTIASVVRTKNIRTLGLQVGDLTQVSMNLIQPDIVGPLEARDAVAAQATIHHAELVGLLPEAVLQRIEESQWEALDLALDRTIEWRMAHRA